MGKIKSRYTVEDYKPDNKYSLSSLFILGIMLFALSIAAGVALSYISDLFYVVILLPCAVGAGIGFAGSAIVRKTGMRNSLICGLVGFASGALAILCMHYTDFMRFSPAGTNYTILNFEEHMKTIANYGVRITRSARQSEGIHFGYTGSFIYWLIEIALTGIVPYLMLSDEASKSFCSLCNKWKKTIILGCLSGSRDNLINAVKSGDFSIISKYGPSRNITEYRLSKSFCETCSSSSVDILLEFVTYQRNGREKSRKIVKVSYPGESGSDFDKLFLQQEK